MQLVCFFNGPSFQSNSIRLSDLLTSYFLSTLFFTFQCPGITHIESIINFSRFQGFFFHNNLYHCFSPACSGYRSSLLAYPFSLFRFCRTRSSRRVFYKRFSDEQIQDKQELYFLSGRVTLIFVRFVYGTYIGYTTYVEVGFL